MKEFLRQTWRVTGWPVVIGGLMGIPVGLVILAAWPPPTPAVKPVAEVWTPAGPCHLPGKPGERLLITITQIEGVFYRDCTFIPVPKPFKKARR